MSNRISTEARLIRMERRYNDRERTLSMKQARFAARLAKGV